MILSNCRKKGVDRDGMRVLQGFISFWIKRQHDAITKKGGANVPYVDTKKMMDYVQECLPGLDKAECLDYVYSQSGANTSKVRYLLKFDSGKMVNFGNNTILSLKAMLTTLETRTKKKAPMDMFYRVMLDFPEDAEVYREADARRDQKKCNTVKNEVDAPETMSELNGETQTAILAEIRAIRELQEETCRFIKTLVFALNGADEKHRIGH